MKNIAKLGLIDRIGRHLQATMSYGDIKAYLQAFGVDPAKPTSGVNSKWVYTKELLADADENLILRISGELGIPHGYVVTPTRDVMESSFWEPRYFRLFLSHLSSFKKTTAVFQRTLRRFGISAFVAHVDIEPTRVWEDEIEAALFSMDALAAILMPGFKESNWTDQEVGVAVGRGVLIIPVIRGLNPNGFIAKYQGLQTSNKTVPRVATELFQILARSPKTRTRMLSCLVDTLLQSTSEEEAIEKLGLLHADDSLPIAFLDKLKEGASSGILAQGKPLEKLNELLIKRGQPTVSTGGAQQTIAEDEVPF
jgi:hypothetical protein